MHRDHAADGGTANRTGAGRGSYQCGGIFSAGVDLLRALDGGPDYFRAFLPTLRGLYECVFFFPKPVVAAIGGHAVAGGCVLACTADRRLMARDAGRIGVTELLVGLPFPAISFEAMRFVTSPRYFQEIVFTAATYLPEAALARGLVDEIVAPEVLRERAIAVARTLAGLSPAAFALSKRQAREPVRTRLDVRGRETDLLVDDIWIAPDTTDRIRDYVARTFKKG